MDIGGILNILPLIQFIGLYKYILWVYIYIYELCFFSFFVFEHELTVKNYCHEFNKKNALISLQIKPPSIDDPKDLSIKRFQASILN